MVLRVKHARFEKLPLRTTALLVIALVIASWFLVLWIVRVLF